MILADTSIWIDHFKHGDAAFSAHLSSDRIACHSFVISEIALGSLRKRGDVLFLLTALPRALVASNDEVMALIETRRLWGRGIGHVDAHLIASTMLGQNMSLWTRDRRLREVAEELGLAHSEP